MLFYSDDLAIFSERAWFSSHTEWFKHLILFELNRFTFTGDQIFFRPGLFTINWLVDVLFRHDRNTVSLIAAFSVFFTASVLFVLLKNWVRESWALLLTLVYLLPTLEDYFIPGWFHLHPFIYGTAFLGLGFHFVIKRGFLIAALCFFLATLFHEITFFALSFVSAFCLVLKEWRKRVFVFGVPAALFLVLWVGTHHQELLTYISAQSTHPEPRVYTFPQAVSLFIQKTLFALVPRAEAFRFPHFAWAFLFTALFFGFHKFFTAPSERRKSSKFDILFFASVIVVISLVVIGGRTLVTGRIGPYYIQISLFFWAGLFALLFASRKTSATTEKLQSILFIVVAFYFSLQIVGQYRFMRSKQAAIYSESHTLQPRKVLEIAKYFKENTNRCYAGIVNENEYIPYFLNRSTDSWLYLFSCASRKKPAQIPTVIVNRTLQSTFEALPILEFMREAHTEVLLTNKNCELRTVPKKLSHNIQQNTEVIAGRKPESEFENCWKVSMASVSPTTVSMEIEQNEPFPPVFAFALSMGATQNQTLSIKASDNIVEIFKGNGDSLELIGNGNIQSFEPVNQVVITEWKKSCVVIFNHHVVALAAQCSIPSGNLAFIALKNNSPVETLKHLRITSR